MTFMINRGKYFPPISPQKKNSLPPANMPGHGLRPCPGILAKGARNFFSGVIWGGNAHAPPPDNAEGNPKGSIARPLSTCSKWKLNKLIKIGI